MRIKTPEEIQSEQARLLEDVIKRVNKALVNGQRSFFPGMAVMDSHIPPGYMTSVKAALEKAGWVVKVRGDKLPNGFLEVCTSKEAENDIISKKTS